MEDLAEVDRLQAGIREWLLDSVRSGRHELRGIPAPAVLPLLCAAAFSPALADAADLTSAGAVARIGVLSSVGAKTLAGVLAGAVDRARSAQASGEPSRHDLQREVGLSIKEAWPAAAWWRSARTASSSPPAAQTGTCGRGMRPPSRKWARR